MPLCAEEDVCWVDPVVTRPLGTTAAWSTEHLSDNDVLAASLYQRVTQKLPFMLRSSMTRIPPFSSRQWSGPTGRLQPVRDLGWVGLPVLE